MSRDGRGPSDDARAKATETKRQNAANRRAALAEVLALIEVQLGAGALKPEEISHDVLRERAGLTNATYWRYLNADPDIALKAAALAWTTRPDRSGDKLVVVKPLGGTSDDGGQEARDEVARLTVINLNLMQQVAACKAVISLLESDLRAKSKAAARTLTLPVKGGSPPNWLKSWQPWSSGATWRGSTSIRILPRWSRRPPGTAGVCRRRGSRHWRIPGGRLRR
ncbi:hypothetical protein ACFQY5_00140 [Paeniroseomonas aquatica]|uniref:hypothetical protein n=1 Tax=Paeniroseomonas aquatica TaxID=373043 RepID=UPI003608683B